MRRRKAAAVVAAAVAAAERRSGLHVVDTLPDQETGTAASAAADDVVVRDGSLRQSAVRQLSGGQRWCERSWFCLVSNRRARWRT